MGLSSILALAPFTAEGKPPRLTAGAADGSVMPRTRSPAVVREDHAPKKARSAADATSGWTRATLRSPFSDRRRRIPRTATPEPFGFKMIPGEKFRFDVNFAGNPAGLAEAEVVAVEADPRGPAPAGAPTVRIEGHARTSGVVSLLATVTDDIVSIIDAHTGAPLHSVNTLDYSGFAPKYKHRVTDQRYEGRGRVRIVDTKDDKVKRRLKPVPLDTFDPMSAMAWVRNLPMEPGRRFKAHVVDGSTLLRIEIEPVGARQPSHMPSIGRALELGQEDVMELKGRLTRVDEYDQPIPGKKAYELKAWISNDERRIPLMMESDMWVGSIRLELSAYDPPPRADAPSGAKPSTPPSADPPQP